MRGGGSGEAKLQNDEMKLVMHEFHDDGGVMTIDTRMKIKKNMNKKEIKDFYIN